MRARTVVLGLIAATGCTDGEGGGDDALSPPTCQPDGILRYVHDLGGTMVDGELPPGSYAFVNKLDESTPGYFEAGDVGGRGGGDRIRVEFEQLIAKGSSTSAAGFAKIGTLDAGNCPTALPSTFRALPDEGWTVTLRALHAPPYCEGAALQGSFAACLVPSPF